MKIAKHMLSTPNCHTEKLKKKYFEGISGKPFFQIITAFLMTV